ncbi:MAG: polyphosphate kinase 1 [Bacteroidetes bacterium]|nr:polyphosphate kinase 1 [Bacteroidota bacterium]
MSADVPIINRELSWLSFNERVLQEAQDKSVPLLERLRFLGIYSNNQDEFYRVRVAFYKRLERLDKTTLKKLHIPVDPTFLLDQIQEKVLELSEQFEETYTQILKELVLNSIFIINNKQLSKTQSSYIKQLFQTEISTHIAPVFLNSQNKFPHIKDRTAYLAVEIFSKAGKRSVYIIEIVTASHSRFIVLPPENKYVILLDDVIRHCLEDIFYHQDYEEINAYTFKITRDAELTIDNDLEKSIVKKISDSVKKRKTGRPTRLAYDDNMPNYILNMLMKGLQLMKSDNVLPGGIYHNFRDFIKFPNIGKAALRFHTNDPVRHAMMPLKSSIFNLISKRDVLLYYPYNTFNHVLEFIIEASLDINTKEIFITLYRVARNSKIVNALIHALKNGKKVTCIIEVTARFDEENNIKQAAQLIEEGANVIYGVPGYKVHSKLLLITRLEDKQLSRYAYISTGNFNEDTARIYSDYGLFTKNSKITSEIASQFGYYMDNIKRHSFQQLLVAPHSMRPKLEKFIKTEIEIAEKGMEAEIIIKANSITDESIIKQLYEASQKGVKIRLIVRGICSIQCKIPGISDNIEAMSLVGRYLEHARVYCFRNKGDPKVYISSADMMSRNLDNRSEVAIPILDEEIKKFIISNLEMQWQDKVKARSLNIATLNQYRLQTNQVGAKKLNYQEWQYQQLKFSTQA